MGATRVNKSGANDDLKLFLEIPLGNGYNRSMTGIIPNPNEDLGFLMRSKCSRISVCSALFAVLQSQTFIRNG
jgi:hypothetical protein